MFIFSFAMSSLPFSQIINSVAHPAAVMETLQAINGELQTSDRAGIVMNFEKVNERNNPRPELANGAAADQKWHKTQVSNRKRKWLC